MDRRKFLKTSTALPILGVAGCYKGKAPATRAQALKNMDKMANEQKPFLGYYDKGLDGQMLEAAEILKMAGRFDLCAPLKFMCGQFRHIGLIYSLGNMEAAVSLYAMNKKPDQEITDTYSTWTRKRLERKDKDNA